MARPFNRRQFLQGIGGLSAGAVVGSKMATGLRLGGSNHLFDTLASRGWAKSPVEFVFLDTEQPNTLDPSLQTEFTAVLVIRNTYDTLTLTDQATNSLKPWLATSWKSSTTGTKWTFTLRTGVKFVDGSAFNAAAVVLSMQRHIAIGASSQAGYMLTGLTSVTATGPMEVAIKTKAPQPWLPDRMTQFPIMSATAINANKTASTPWAKTFFASHCVGTGAYELASWTRGTKLTLTKNKTWWGGPWAAGSIDKVTIQWESDSGTIAQLLESGTANFSTVLPIDDAITVGKKSGFSLKRYKAYNTDPMIAFNQAKPPFDKLEVRQAFQYAFDYEAMRNYFRGYASATSGVIPPFNPYALKSLPIYKQDLEKAKSLLAKAKVNPSSLTPTCYTAAGYPDLVAGGTVLQSSLSQIGVNVKLQSVPFTTLETVTATVGKSPDITSALYNGILSLDPTSFISEFLPGNFGADDFMRYKSTALAAAFKQASESATTATAKKGLDKCQQIIHDDAPVIFGALPEMLVPVPNYLEGFEMLKTTEQYPVLFYQLRLRAH